jgi:hypothetical protein
LAEAPARSKKPRLSPATLESFAFELTVAASRRRLFACGEQWRATALGFFERAVPGIKRYFACER